MPTPEADFPAALAHLESKGAHPEHVIWEDGRGRSAYLEDADRHVVGLWTWPCRTRRRVRAEAEA